jgi:hypothetical protein
MAENAKKWGGKRFGAGRPKGRVTEKLRQDLAKEGVSPLNYLCDIMRDPKVSEKRRDWAASIAISFMHPRLNAIAMQHSNTEPVREITWRILGPADAPLIEHDESEAETEH